MATATSTDAPPGTARAERRPRGLRRDGRYAWLFLGPSLAGLALFTLFPTAMALGISLFDWPVFGQRTFLGVDNFSHLLNDPIFRKVIFNTTLFVVLYVPLNVIVSLGLAVWLGPRVWGRQAFRVLFFIPVMTPMVANVMVWRLLLQPGGLFDSGAQSVFGVDAPNFLGSTSWAMPTIVAISVWQGFGYNFLVFSAALDQVPQSQLDSAAIDGAGPLQRFRYITWPMITPSIFFATTLTLITAFQVFAQPFILTGGGPGVSTQTLVMYVYNQGWQFLNMGLAAAAGWVLFVIIMGITAIQFIGQKRWVHYDA
ncbi:sugar ABC transporter permease [Streptomyces sp. SID13031]|uniref:carbohydrate ABC transporter permease n=1 Tax=Streptomyces sp. SID13031 TaxID=2706046 RepID=UPI0013C6147A|nr:sugar ABC transporter permease [Streptomyces sp. SID13031]NEA32245.1 sugar ABC transporter permease [Streptomyces sp. SID13031]